MFGECDEFGVDWGIIECWTGWTLDNGGVFALGWIFYLIVLLDCLVVFVFVGVELILC